MKQIITDGVMSGLVYGVGQLEAKSAKLSKTSISESKPDNFSNTCSIKLALIKNKSCPSQYMIKDEYLRESCCNLNHSTDKLLLMTLILLNYLLVLVT